MTSIPLELPLKASEAASLAELVFQHAEGRPLNDDLRARLGGRGSALGLSSLRPYWGSLQQDPVHGSTYYLAVDALADEVVRPLLLRIALASAPSSGLFPKSMLIGRMRPGGGREVVVNAIPFSAQDAIAIQTYAEKVDRAFLPRAQGTQSAVAVQVRDPEASLPAVFDAFGQVSKSAGVNLASITLAGNGYEAGVWAAIRSGWREGYSMAPAPFIASVEHADALRALIEDAACFSRFTLVVPKGIETEDALSLCEKLHDHIRQVRAGSEQPRSFDFELSLEVSPTATSVEELTFALDWFRRRGRPVQLIEPRLDFGSGGEELLARLAELAAAARQFQTTLSVRVSSSMSADLLRGIGNATAGRVNAQIEIEEGAGEAARQRRIEWITAVAMQIRGQG